MKIIGLQKKKTNKGQWERPLLGSIFPEMIEFEESNVEPENQSVAALCQR